MAHFSAQARKIRKLKKIPLWKNFLYSPFSNFSLYFGKLNFLVPNLKKLKFFLKNFFLNFRWELAKPEKQKKNPPWRNFFSKKVFSHILGCWCWCKPMLMHMLMKLWNKKVNLTLGWLLIKHKIKNSHNTEWLLILSN